MVFFTKNLIQDTNFLLKCQKLKQKIKSTIYWTHKLRLMKVATRGFQKKINRELEAFLSKENNDKDNDKDDVFDFLKDLLDSAQEEFDKLLAGDSGKKPFVRAVSRFFALLLNTKVDTAEKIKRIIKTAIETTLKIWQEPKLL